MTLNGQYTPTAIATEPSDSSAPSHLNRNVRLCCWPSTFSAQRPLRTTSLSFIIHLSACGRHELNSQHLGFGIECYLLTIGNKWEALRQMAHLQSTDCHRKCFSYPAPVVTLKLITFHFSATHCFLLKWVCYQKSQITDKNPRHVLTYVSLGSHLA